MKQVIMKDVFLYNKHDLGKLTNMGRNNAPNNEEPKIAQTSTEISRHD